MSLIGPYVGFYHVDIKKNLLQLKSEQGYVDVLLNREQILKLIGLMPMALEIDVVKISKPFDPTSYSKPISVYPERPKTISCRHCNTKIEVSKYGKIPTYCKAHRTEWDRKRDKRTS